jgi:hypothetical protein
MALGSPNPLRKRRSSTFRIDVADDHLLDAMILGELRGMEQSYSPRAQQPYLQKEDLAIMTPSPLLPASNPPSKLQRTERANAPSSSTRNFIRSEGCV